MEYPQLPTDNLYKFLALTGLALLFFSVTYPINKTIEIKLRLIEVSAQVEKRKLELSEIKREGTRLDAILADSQAAINKGNGKRFDAMLSDLQADINKEHKSEIVKAALEHGINLVDIKDGVRKLEAIEASLVKHGELSEKHLKKILEYQLKGVDLDATLKRIDVQEGYLASYRMAAYLGSILGVLLSIIGFLLWYYRIQRPNDKATTAREIQSNHPQ